MRLWVPAISRLEVGREIAGGFPDRFYLPFPDSQENARVMAGTLRYAQERSGYWKERSGKRVPEKREIAGAYLLFQVFAGSGSGSFPEQKYLPFPGSRVRNRRAGIGR